MLSAGFSAKRRECNKYQQQGGASMAKEICDELEKLLRAQRHDFLNYLQVIRALVQMGRTEKALKYIDDLAKDPSLLAEPLRQHREQTDCRRKAGL
jgi:pentatricopeptide repeat protein